MKDDLIERARQAQSAFTGGQSVIGDILGEMADALEAMQAEIERLKDKLESINRATSAGSRTLDEMCRDMGWANDCARSALHSLKEVGDG